MNSRKYYLCITPFFPSPDRWQGAYVLDQVKAIQRHSSYEVIVFKTHSLTDKEKDYTIDGIRVHCIRPLLMPSYILNGLTESIVGKMFVHSLEKLRVSLEDVAFVHCHTANHAAFGFGVKRLNPSVKVLLQFHDLDPFTLRNGIWADKRWNRRFRAKRSVSALNKADLLVCISECVSDAIMAFPKPRKEEVFEPAIRMLDNLKDMPAVRPRKMYVLNNGVDTSLFRCIENKKTDIYRIGCIANFQELKDHQTLVEAFNILIKKGYTDMRLSLLGSGATRPRIEQYVHDHELDGYVEWPREVHHNQLPDYYNTLDLFVLPSRFEGFGCVYTEAYACDVPFICCEHQGAAECVAPDERHLWLTKDRAPEHLATLIERQYLERNKQHLCKEYDIDKLISKYVCYLKTI